MSGWLAFLRLMVTAQYAADLVHNAQRYSGVRHWIADLVDVAFFMLFWWLAGKAGRHLDAPKEPRP